MDNTGQRERYAELDLIRFLAAMSVLVYHYKSKYVESLADSPSLAHSIYAVTKFGYLGVDLFFIISGFVIFASALDRSAFQFAVSRATRIYPTLWVCVTITALISLCIRGAESHITLIQWLANLTLFNSRLGIEDIDGVYWTLAIEISFYFCVFALLLLNLFKYYRVWIPLWLLFTVCFLLFKQPFFMGWFVSPEYSSYFIAGIIFYMIRKEGFHLFHVAVLLPALIISSVYAYRTIGTFAHDVSETDRYVAVAAVWGFHLLFLGIATRRLTIRASALVLALGGMTYPLYLLHNRAGKEIYESLIGRLPSLPLLLMIAAGMLFVAWLVHVYLEQRIADRLKYYLLSTAGRFRSVPGR